VTIHFQWNERPHRRRRSTHSCRTADDGSYWIDELTAGRYRVSLGSREPYELRERLEVDVVDGEQYLDIALHASETASFEVSGQVVNAQGEPIAGVEVRVTGLWSQKKPTSAESDYRRFGTLREPVKTDEHGRFVIAGPREAGTVGHVRIYTPGVTTDDLVRYFQGDDSPRIFAYDGAPIRVVLARVECCRLRLHLKKADGTPASNAAVFRLGPRGYGAGGQCQDPGGVFETTLCGEIDILIATGTRLDISAHVVCETAGETFDLILEPKPPDASRSKACHPVSTRYAQAGTRASRSASWVVTASSRSRRRRCSSSGRARPGLGNRDKNQRPIRTFRIFFHGGKINRPRQGTTHVFAVREDAGRARATAAARRLRGARPAVPEERARDSLLCRCVRVRSRRRGAAVVPPRLSQAPRAQESRRVRLVVREHREELRSQAPPG